MFSFSRCAFLVASSLFLSGCTAVMDDVYATFDYVFSSSEDVSLSAEEIEAFPYTAQYANWDDNPRSLLVLGYVDAGQYSWISGDGETVVTQQGRIVRTAKLDVNVVAVSNLASDPLRCIVQQPDCPTEWRRIVDIHTEDERFSRVVSSSFSNKGLQTLELSTGARQVYHIVETGHFGLQENQNAGDSFRNDFWLESDGHVVKSRQVITPRRATLELTEVKWVGRE